ncbi:uncharacterized protein BYT42DRAFT_551162 [Radiomyces spectabilis]|uniref:uncharacterized protein n=1 Tax=Radiomyces spectabilis TaxID=64574 RepID=UPI00222003B8|nr:uncharacterized protein BYT42DRAFT_551162 [Radiomyces spectabilis]KAI8393479.1 hypothetical protein BYT42DRAFT_551162 [Radiomyces spectabilis]
MSSSEPSGFRGAPVTKLLVTTVGTCSALSVFLNARFDVSLHQLVQHHQLWRLAASPWAFPTIGTAAVGTWLIYKMRIIERRFGSSKYSAFIFVCIVFSTLLQVGSLSMVRWIASGPYALVFAMIFCYRKLIPANAAPQTPEQFAMTDKFYIYTAAFQLMISHSVSSIIPCACGWVISQLYQSNVGYIKQWRFPSALRSFASSYILPILSTKSKSSTSSSRASNSPSIARPSGSRQRRGVSAQTSRVSEENIRTVSSMFPGYSRETIINAIVSARYDLNRAAEILLTSNAS